MSPYSTPLREPRLPTLKAVLASMQPLIDWHMKNSQTRRLAVTVPQYKRLQKAAAEREPMDPGTPPLVQEIEGVRFRGFLLYPQLAPPVAREKVS